MKLRKIYYIEQPGPLHQFGDWTEDETEIKSDSYVEEYYLMTDKELRMLITTVMALFAAKTDTLAKVKELRDVVYEEIIEGKE